MARSGRGFPLHPIISTSPVSASTPVTLSSDTPAGARTGSPADAVAVGVTVASDVPAGTRTGAPADTLAIGVTLASDAPAGARAGRPVDAPAIDVALGSDTPAGSRTGAPVDALGATVTSDAPAGARTGAPADSPIIGVAVTDVPAGSRAGAPADALMFDVRISSDIPAGTRTGSPVDTPVNGLVLTSDAPAGTRAGAPVDAPVSGVVLTSDAPAGSRAGAPADALALGVVLASDVPAGARTGVPVDTLPVGVTVASDAPAGARTGAPVDTAAVGVTVASDVPAGARSGAPADRLVFGVTLTSDVPAGARTGAPVDVLSGAVPYLPAQLANPNWPLLGFEVDFQTGSPNIPGATRVSIDASYRRLAVRKWSTRRGRQYELDQVQAGEATLEVTDPRELLNPDNPGSPLNQGANVIVPYRSMWMWGMWPTQPGAGNLFARSVLGPALFPTSVDPTFEQGTGLIDYGWDGTATVASSTAQAWQGTRSALVTQTAPGFAKGVYVHQTLTCVPGITYTASFYVYPTGGCTVQCAARDATPRITYGSTATAQNTWTRISVTWTAVDTLEYINISGSGSATPTFHVDGAQLEFGATATAWTVGGPTLYPIYTGFVERYPTKYDMAGLRANRPLLAVDALAILSRADISQSYVRTTAADGPAVYGAYTEQAGPNLFTSQQGLSLLGSMNTAPQGGQINFAGDTFLDGSGAVALSQQSQDPTKTPRTQQITSVDIPHGNSFSVYTGGATFEFWARWRSGTVTLGMFEANASGEFVDFTASSSDHTRDVCFGATLGFGGMVLGACDGQPGASQGNVIGVPATATFSNDGSNNLPDGQWHYYSIALFPGAGADAGRYLMRMCIDGQITTTTAAITSGNGSPIRFLGFNAITTAVSTRWADPVSAASIAKVAFYPADIGAARQVAHYQRGAGFARELSGARAARLLGQYWAGLVKVAGGFMSMAADFGYHGRVVLDCLQEIQESERGLTYANAAGQVVFEDRLSRYYNTNDQPAWVFGENPAGANPTEYPYEEYATDFDATYTFSQANLSRPGNSNFPPMINQPARAMFGQRILTQTVQCLSDYDLTQTGIFYLHRYASPRTRITTLKLNPAANPQLFPVVMSLEIGMRIRVNRRTDALLVSRDYYVEKIEHQVDADRSSWITTLQVSPVFVPQTWLLGDTTRGVLGASTVPVY